LASDLQGDKLYCKICAKSFLNSGSFASHLDSKKHLDRLKLTGSEDDSDLTELSVVSEDRKVSEKGVSTTNEQKDVEMADNEDDWEDEDDDGQ
jgi:Zinc-finger double-stranded RNA-binding